MKPVLTPAECSLIIKNTKLPPGLRQKLSSANEGRPRLTINEITTLSVAVIQAYTTLNNQKTRKALNHILIKLLSTGEEVHSQPRELSPQEVSILVDEDWTPGTPGLQLNYDLTTAGVISAPIIARSKLLLEALAENPAKATSAGNLNRKFVALMMEQMDIPDDFMAYLKGHHKVINESDVPPLEITRIVLELAGLIKLKKQKFQVAPLAATILDPGGEGTLFLLLFVTFFKDFNIAFGDRMRELPEFQDAIGYSLYQLSSLKGSWHDLSKTSAQLMLPSLAARIPSEPIDFRSALVARRFLVHLELFGMVELRREDDPSIPEHYRTVVGFRKTRLLRRAIKFGF